MSRTDRRHQSKEKKSYAVWIVLAVIVLVTAGLWIYNQTKGTGVDYSLYSYTDDVFAAPKATVVIEEFSDFQCPACRNFEPTMKAIRDSYPEKVRVVYKEFPLRQIHEYAQGAAEAAECARMQNRFWAYHDVLFDSKLIDERNLKLHAKGLGLDMTAWQTCIDKGEGIPPISASILEGTNRDVQGTPTVFVNGELFEGRTVQAFEARINQK